MGLSCLALRCIATKQIVEIDAKRTDGYTKQGVHCSYLLISFYEPADYSYGLINIKKPANYSGVLISINKPADYSYQLVIKSMRRQHTVFYRDNPTRNGTPQRGSTLSSHSRHPGNSRLLVSHPNLSEAAHYFCIFLTSLKQRAIISECNVHIVVRPSGKYYEKNLAIIWSSD